jgi:hypothetical protein
LDSRKDGLGLEERTTDELGRHNFENDEKNKPEVEKNLEIGEETALKPR